MRNLRNKNDGRSAVHRHQVLLFIYVIYRCHVAALISLIYNASQFGESIDILNVVTYNPQIETFANFQTKRTKPSNEAYHRETILYRTEI